MRLSTKCKCGSEFSARGFYKNVGITWGIWQQLHAHCIDIESYDIDETDEGLKVRIRPLKELAERVP